MSYSDVQAIDTPRIVVGKESIGDELEHQPWGLEFVNWFVRNFLTDGKDLYDLLVTPITGDFNRIKANGDAWAYARDALPTVGENLRQNVAKLTDNHWHGEAANNARLHIEKNFATQLEMAAGISGLMGKAVTMVGEGSLKAARVIADRLIPKVLGLIESLAKKLMPSGLAAMAWDFFTSGFEFPFKQDVENIKQIISAILNIHKAIKAMCAIGVNLTTGVQAIVEGFRQIPEIDSAGEAFAVGAKIEDSAERIARDHVGQKNEDGGRKPSKYQQSRNQLDQGSTAILARLNPTIQEAKEAGE